MNAFYRLNGAALKSLTESGKGRVWIPTLALVTSGADQYKTPLLPPVAPATVETEAASSSEGRSSRHLDGAPACTRMDELISQVMGGVVSSNKRRLQEVGFYEAFMGFIHAIRWEEPWIVMALASYGVLLLIVVLLRKRPNVQIGIFVFLCGAVWGSRYINDFLQPRWQELGFTQNYFDKHGVFMSMLYSAPLLLIASFQMLYALFTSGSLLIKVKRNELRQLQAQRRAENNSSNGSATSDPSNTATTTESRPLAATETKKTA